MPIDPQWAEAEAHRLGLGPTDKQPNANPNPLLDNLGLNDKGGLDSAIVMQDGMVVLLFGTQLQFVAMTPEQAVELAYILIQRARMIIAARTLRRTPDAH